MAFTSFTLEGEAVLGFFAREFDDRHVRMQEPTDPSVPVAVSTDASDGERIETIISRALGFPSDSEFDEMSNRNHELREQGLQTVAGIPDLVRRGTRLRITVEVLED